MDNDKSDRYRFNVHTPRGKVVSVATIVESALGLLEEVRASTSPTDRASVLTAVVAMTTRQRWCVS